jgi:hypothetical protein
LPFCLPDDPPVLDNPAAIEHATKRFQGHIVLAGS